MKIYAKKRDLIRAVQWTGDMSPDMTELIGPRKTGVNDARQLFLGNGWYARVGDWIYALSGKGSLSVISDKVFRETYEEVDEVTPAAEDHEVAAHAFHHPLNQAIDRMIAADRTSPSEDLLAKVQSMCMAVPIGDLRAAIEDHRAGCHQLPSCPILAAMLKEVAP